MSNNRAEASLWMIDSERICLAQGTIESEAERAGEEEAIVELAPDECVELPSAPPPLVPSRRRTVPVIHA
jgi:hypothetical protein